MSVQSDISSIQYTGNGSAVTPYPVPFVFHEAVHLRVVVIAEDGVQTELRLGTDYVVAGAGAKTGGSVTTKAPVPTTRKVSIYREVPVVQQAKLVENGPMPATTIERGLDALTMVCQQLERKVARTFRMSDSGPAVDPMTSVGSGSNSVLVMGEDGGFHLWNMQKFKEEISAMAAVPAMLNALQVLYPVGCLYFTRRSENPRDILGFGTWRRFGAGRTIVSLDPSNPALAYVDMEGGEAEHALTEEELAKHVHVVPAVTGTAEGGGHTHPVKVPKFSTMEAGEHLHEMVGYQNDDGASRTPELIIDDGRRTGVVRRNTEKAGKHSHEVEIAEFNSGENTNTEYHLDIPEQNTREAGEGKPHNNMPPYIVVHVWTRILSDAPEEGVGTLPFPADPTLLVDRVTGETRRLVVDDAVIGTVPESEPSTT